MHNHMETNGFWPKNQNREVPSQIYSSGGPVRVFAGKGWARLTRGVKIRSFQLWQLGTSNSSALYPFFWILEPRSKFKRSKSIFSEISSFQGIIPIIACRSAKMAARHLRDVP